MLGRIIIGIDDRYRCWQFYSRFANIYTFDKKIQMLAVLLVLSDVGKSMYRLVVARQSKVFFICITNTSYPNLRAILSYTTNYTLGNDPDY